MTIAASCDQIGTQSRDLAMKRLEITLCNLRVTSSALLENLLSETAEIHACDRVRKVAGAADGKFFISLRDSLAVNAGRKLLIDAVVTASARRSHIIGMNTGQWVIGRQFSVTRMAIHTGSCYQKTTLEQALAMNAHRIVLENFSLISRICNCSFLTFPVALPTQFRDVSCEGWRCLVGLGLLSVSLMAI